MADQVKDLLDRLNTSNRVRAAAWDAVYAAKDSADFLRRLEPLPFAPAVKAQLWDLRFGQGTTLPAKQGTASPDQELVAARARGETWAGLWDAKFGRHPLSATEHVVEGGKEFLRGINPLPMIEGVGKALIPEAIGSRLGLGKTGPLNALQADMTARNDLYTTATTPVETAEAFLPFVGPALAERGRQLERGEIGKGIGGTLALGATMFAPQAAAATKVRVPAVASNLNPLEQQAVQFAAREGVPVDAATATGRRFIRNVQTRAANSMGGFPIHDEFVRAQTDALRRTGNDLASRANATSVGRPGQPTDMVRAGEAVTRRLESRINAQNRMATSAYEELRAIEAQQAQRIQQTSGVQAPPNARHPNGAGMPFTTVPLAVDVGSAKVALRPLYEQLKREGELNIPMQGGRGRTLAALDGLMNGPDLAPLSVVDAVLGDLKAMARTGDLPALRTQGQATAAEAVKALERQVTDTATAAGTHVYAALQRGRQATVGKYETAAVRDALAEEPAQIARQLTTGKDINLDRLRAVSQQAPREIPKVARAYLEHLMDIATGEGGFGHGDRLWSEWQKLGPETKAILFRDRALIKDLDHFFLLVKKAGENPNPSGTASTLTALNVGSVPLTAALAKLLYSRQGVRALTHGFTVRASPRLARTAQAGAVAQLTKLAQENAGVPVPAVAEDSTER